MTEKANTRRKGKPRETSGSGRTGRAGATWRSAVRVVLRIVAALALALVLWVLAYRWIDPPTTPYILSESARLNGVDRVWTDLDDIAPVMARAVVAAEDANFCRHWGFDIVAIRNAISAGGNRGASTISQQVVKNTFLWQGRSWPRKALEALLTPLVEAVWPKRRIVEIYLNVAEMGPGIFGADAAARHWFGVSARDLTARQASLIAAILPAPKRRDPARPSDFVDRRARSIADGAATIRTDGRAACFED